MKRAKQEVEQTENEAAKEERCQEGEKPARKLFEVSFFLDWCKSCGICIAFCPKKIILADKIGKPVIKESDKCVGCCFCEIHCPDFAVTVTKRYPKRRKSDVP